MEQYVADRFAAHDDEERAERLADLLEDDEIYAQRARAQRLSMVFSVDAAPPAQPAPAAAPAPGAPVPAEAGQVPADAAAGKSATDAAGMDWEAWNVAAENSARYVVVQPGIGNLNQREAAATQQAPQQAPPAPPAPVQE
jgi:hypothetical protein